MKTILRKHCKAIGCLILAVCFFLPSTAGAISYEDTPNIVGSTQLVWDPSTYNAVHGDAGGASVYWVGDNKIFWEVSAYQTTAPVTLAGEITLYRGAAYQEYVWSTNVSGTGIGIIEGKVAIPSWIPGGTYTAVFTGTGTIGGRSYRILEGCTSTEYI